LRRGQGNPAASVGECKKDLFAAQTRGALGPLDLVAQALLAGDNTLLFYFLAQQSNIFLGRGLLVRRRLSRVSDIDAISTSPLR
jgi:hypothetical protein